VSGHDRRAHLQPRAIEGMRPIGLCHQRAEWRGRCQ
jgi:hypothetical protein